MSRQLACNWSTSQIITPALAWFCGENVLITASALVPPVSISGWTIAAYLRKNAGDAAVLLTYSGSITDSTNGVWTISLAAADTLNLTPGSYDLEMSRIDSGNYTVLARAAVTLNPR